jgi:hypothetical protein
MRSTITTDNLDLLRSPRFDFRLDLDRLDLDRLDLDRLDLRLELDLVGNLVLYRPVLTLHVDPRLLPHWQLSTF